LSQKLHRRTILQCIAAVAASTAFGCSDEETARQQGREYFPQSIASGDPRPDSVVLWTRAVDPASADADTTVRLEVSEREDFSTLVLEMKDLKALKANDHALKVKVGNLSPRTTYYYRFVYEKDGTLYSSNTGRTRTAPAADDAEPVRFAFASCQDYIGRYYNTWQRLLQLPDIDFVVFLGDYIYETTGDASFQSSSAGGRTVQFSDTAEAIPQKTGVLGYHAAASLSNYRDVYKTVRSDRVLQEVHERFPFIIMWDDHEFSDDSWGDVATYEDGKKNEQQTQRRQNAERAFFEFIPLDHAGTAEGAIAVEGVPTFPNTRIYRDFDFGKNLKLVVTDMRTYRPDHLIPEDAYPGTVVVPEAVLTGGGARPLPPPFASDVFAYVDIDARNEDQTLKYAQQKAVLQGAYTQQAIKAGVSDTDASAKAGALIKGPLALAYINEVLKAVNPALVISPAGASKGVAFLHMGKQGLFDIRGSRYIVVKDTFDLYAQVKYAQSQRASEDVLGAAQESWFLETMKNAPQTWKVAVSSVSLTSMIWDLRDKADIPEATLRQRFYFNADQWDGFPTKRTELLKALREQVAGNPLFISGDIHASFASVEQGIPALTTPAISSGSIQELAATAVRGAGYTTESAVYRHAVANMDATMKAANPGLVFSNADHHGFVVLEVREDEAIASYHLIPSREVGVDYSKRDWRELGPKFVQRDFRVTKGSITPL
jgi:alkaline phosphatase D